MAIRSATSPLAALALAAALVVSACGGAGTNPAASQPNAAAPTATKTATPAPRQKIVVAISGDGVQMNKVPTMIAIEAMKADGIDAEPTFLSKSEAPVEAVLKGDAQIGIASFVPVAAAIAQGADLKAVAVARNTEYLLVARKPIAKPEDLDGKRIGINAEISSTTMLTKLYLQNSPSTKPQYIVVTGSPARVTAMLANQLDASAMQLGDEVTIFAQRPNDFTILFNYAKELPDLIDSIVVVNAKYLAANRAVVKSFVKRLIEAHRKVAADTAFYAQKATQFDVILPKGSDVNERAKVTAGAGVFPRDGGLTTKAMDYTIKANKDTGIIKESFPADKLVDRTVLDEVLKELP